eukprot:9504184-Pyramimonas_sp.AAC.3
MMLKVSLAQGAPEVPRGPPRPPERSSRGSEGPGGSKMAREARSALGRGHPWQPPSIFGYNQPCPLSATTAEPQTRLEPALPSQRQF